MKDRELIARSFTDSAGRAINHVRERALDRGMFGGELNDATVGMLALLSILRWELKVGRAALERVGADRDVFARELDFAIEEESCAVRKPGGPEFTTLPSGEKGLVFDADTPLRPLLTRAEDEARGLGHDWVGTEHLTLAAIRFACPRLEAILHNCGITYEAVRTSVQDVLRG